MINAGTRARIWHDANWKCYYCGDELEDNPTIDHKIPISKGGTDDPENLVACCSPCNSSKRDRTESDFVAHVYHQTRAGSFHLALRSLINGNYPEKNGAGLIDQQEWEFLENLSQKIFDKYPRPSFPASIPLQDLHNQIMYGDSKS